MGRPFLIASLLLEARMLFLVKRSVRWGLAALLGLVLLGVGLRSVIPDAPPFQPSALGLLGGVGLFLAILTSDILIHGVLCLVLGDRYRARHRELAEVFRTQTVAAMFVGASVAGLGEELVFRGLSFSLAYAAAAAGVFGVLHHVRRSLWVFTPWAAYQSCLLSAGLVLTGSLFATMVAHFLHDLTGFALFRYLNRTGTRSEAVGALSGSP
jgi:membrane protease YdiL (CAAX protease family)